MWYMYKWQVYLNLSEPFLLQNGLVRNDKFKVKKKMKNENSFTSMVIGIFNLYLNVRKVSLVAISAVI